MRLSPDEHSDVALCPHCEEWIDTDPRLEERGIDREEFRAAGALREQAAAENARRLFDAWLRAWANGG